MDEETYHLLVPRLLDEPPKFLFWDFDVAIVFLGLLFFGIMAGFFLTSIILALGAGYAIQRMKSGKSKGYGLHILYWYLPINLFKRTPPSCIREFIG
jgi:conjugal transfer pilus assembly protein TraL